MGLYKRNKVWWMNFSLKGVQVRRSTETVNKMLAQKIYHKVMAEVAEGKWFDIDEARQHTFEEMTEKYLTEYCPMNKAESTIVRDESYLRNHLVPAFGGLTLNKITPKIVSQYKYRKLTEGLKLSTVALQLKIMSKMFSLAMKEWEWVQDNPVTKVSIGKINNEVDRWLTIEEEEKLLSLSPRWLWEIIVFALNTGLRRGEILSLTWKQVDLFRKTITILEQKNKSKDTLPLNAKAMEIMKSRAKIRSIKNDLVFFSRNGTKLKGPNVLRSFKLVAKSAEIYDLRFHDLRHTFATRMIQAGVDIYKVQKLLRHKSRPL